MNDGILKGVRVIDLTRYVSGPFCAALLADMGAEVIKIEKPGTGEVSRKVAPYHDGVSLFFPPYNRNKKSVTADLRTPEGIAIAKRLNEKSDVLINNFRVGTLEKMGLDYETLKAINPGIIVVSITGFGQEGPMKDRLAFDGIISALSGVTRMENGHVERSKGPIHDYMAAVYAAFGTVLALYEKKNTGKGQYLDVSMLACSSMIRTTSIADAALNGEKAAEGGDDSAPFGYIRARDGWINFHAGTNRFYENLLGLIDDPFLHQPQFIGSIPNRIAQADELMEHIQRWGQDKSCDELEELFTGAGIPSGIVATPLRIRDNAQLQYNHLIVPQEVTGIDEKVPYMAFPVRMSNHKELCYRRAPGVGEQNEEIYTSLLGMQPEEIAVLKEKGIL